MARDNPDCKVVILCGGMGARLREETEYRPKPLVEIGEKPILWHIMKIYSYYGFRDFILCLGYKGKMIKDYFINYEIMNCDFTVDLGSRYFEIHNKHEEKDWRITLAETGEKAMTGARVKRIEKYVDTTSFMLTYGDGVADLDIRQLFKFHKAHGRIGTVTGVRPTSRFGELIVEEDNRVSEFSEKPQVREGFINGGFFVFEREFFDYLLDDDACVLEKKPLEKLSQKGDLMVYKHDGFWQCMDTYRDVQLLSNLWLSPERLWKVWK
ncbi:MAG: glucose-1-phosphate cytidylyltransferase [Methanotrichaceae archaeon]|nr:glucose-1-phosphate cytidylyltransferase [Methanotrichaceae archaeon]